MSIVYAAIYGGLILRTLVFFGCAWVFMNLFRGEVVDRSLHYYFLAPVRREVLVVGKYLSGLVATIVLFSITTVGSMLMLYFWLFPSQSARVFFRTARVSGRCSRISASRFSRASDTARSFCSSVCFSATRSSRRLLLYGWEWINFLLPPLLKKISVIHYLQSLVPVPMSEGPFAVLVEPTPAWISVPSLLLFTGVVLFLAGLHIRRMEISYAGE